MPKRTYLLGFAVLYFLEIFAQDITPPVFVQAPISISVPCEVQNIPQQFTAWYSTAGNAIVFDDNGGSIQLVGTPTFSEAQAIFNASQDTLCGRTRSVEVTFVAIDQSGNMSLPAKAKFSTFDNVPPSITTSPMAFNGECTANTQMVLNNWIKNKAGAIASDVCSDSVIWTNFVFTTSNNQSGQASIANGPYPVIPANACNWFVNVSFYFEDQCGNNGATAIRKFEIRDTKAPVFSISPSNITVSCNAIPLQPNISALDDCSGNTTVNFIESSTQSFDTLSCNHYNYTITRNWSTTDHCNNSKTHEQIITVKDTIKPQVDFENNITIDCNNKSNLDSILIKYTDNCSQVIITYQDSLLLLNSCISSFIRKYVVKDVCENTITFNQNINTTDNSKPVISTPASNKSFGCNAQVDLQQEFVMWLNSRGGSHGTDVCGNIKSFYALPGSYNLSDTASFPGTQPLGFNNDKCNTTLPGWSRTQIIDFVYYDDCGNAEVTSAVFGITDHEAPEIINCPIEIVKNIETQDCITPIVLEVPDVIDNCGSATSPIVKTTTAVIKSSQPGMNTVIVDSILVVFEGYNPNSFSINGTGLLTLEMLKVDADNSSEFFRVYDENGLLLGQTNHTAQQCQDVITDITGIPINMLNTWLEDGKVSFKLVPNIASEPVLSINDICPSSRLNASLSFPIDENNLVQSYFTLQGTGDTINTTQVSSIVRNLNAGIYNAQFIFEDCAKNNAVCNIAINIRDAFQPVIQCNPDTVIFLENENCGINTSIPIKINVEDNCQLPLIYDEVQPNNINNSYLTFKYLENLNRHLANNKTIIFNNVPLVKHTNDDVSLEVTFQGDNNNATEYFDVLGEGGFIIGKTNRTNETGCGVTTTKFLINKNTFNNWAKDGNVILTAVAFNNDNEEGNGINPCFPLQPDQNVDNISSVTMRLSVSDAAIAYAHNNGNPISIDQQHDSISLNLTNGINTLQLFTSDNYGNSANCSFTIEVRDTIKPEAKCKNFIARLHPSGTIPFVLVADSLNDNSLDNCSIDSIWHNGIQYSCSNIGTEESITFFVSDASGNVSTCTSKVRFENTILNPTYTAGLCEGDTLQLFANIPLPQVPNAYQYRWTKDGIFVANEENPAFISNGTQNNGLYKIEVTGFNGCKAEGFVQVSIQPLALPVITTDQSSYCLNDTVTIEGTSYFGDVIYEWYEGFAPQGVLIKTTSIPQLRLAPNLGIHNYYLIVRNENCVSSASPTKKITIYNKPDATVTLPFQTICEGQSITLSTNSSGAGYKYSWSGPNMYTDSLKNPPLITNVQNVNQGLYELIVNVGECKSEIATVNVVVLPKPAKPVISGEDIYCEGTTLSLAVTNLSPQEKYFWIKDGVLFKVTQGNFLEILNVQSNASGIWQVVVESNTCVSDTSVFKNIEVADLTIVGASNTGPHCEGDTVTLIATSVPNATYLWKGPEFSAIGQQVKTVAKPGEYFVTITTSTGCTNITSTTLEVNKAPVITAMSNTNTKCLDGNTNILFSPSISPAGNYTYKWTGPLNFSSIERNAVIANASPINNGVYIFTAFNKTCPSQADTTLILITTAPEKATINHVNSSCEGEDLLLTTNAMADSFLWVTPLGTIITTTPSLLIPMASISNEGNYHLLIQQDGCTSSEFEITNIEISPKPASPVIIGQSEFCFNDTILLKMSSSAFDDVVWTLPNGNKQNSATLLIPRAKKSDEGQYTVQIAVDGCLSNESLDFVVVVKDEIKISTFLDTMVAFCSNDDTPIELCMNSNSLTLGATYVWNNELGMELNNGDEICRIITGGELKEGNNFIYTTTFFDGCKSEIGRPVLIVKSQAPAIKAEANFDVKYLCATDEIVELISTTKEPAVDVKWTSLSNGIDILNPDADKTLAQNFLEGQNIIILSYSKDGCLNFSYDTVFIRYQPAPTANDDSYIIEFNTTTDLPILINDLYPVLFEIEINDENLKGNVNINDNVFTYTPKQGFAGVDEFIYTLCIEDCPNLCQAASVRLTVGNNVECTVPTIFTPNGDGINDFFAIPCIETGKYGNCELYIYNQWGDQVYYANPYENTWQGTFGGNELPVGTYYYVFAAQKNVNPVTGFLILQR